CSPRSQFFEATRELAKPEARSGPAKAAAGPRASGDLEVVPALVHVGCIVHQRVPTRDVGHSFYKRAAIAHRAGLLHGYAIGVADRPGRRLAFVPIRPFGIGHEFLRGRGRRAVIAVAADEGTLP